MGENSYYTKEEEKFREVINTIKSLPKVEADDNFEYNLMVKINNRNFSLKYEERSFGFSRALVPAAALVFSVVIVFFLGNDSTTVNLENPFLFDPPAREGYSAATADTIEMRTSRVSASMENSMMDNIQESVISNGAVRVVVEPNDVVTVERIPPPFDYSKSLDLDSYVSGRENKTSSANMGTLVSGGQQSLGFDGFLIRERPSQEVIEYYRAIRDSLRKSTISNK